MNERAQLLRLIESLLDTLRPEGVAIWLTSYNRCLGDNPRNLMARGEWGQLHAEAERLAGGTPWDAP